MFMGETVAGRKGRRAGSHSAHERWWGTGALALALMVTVLGPVGLADAATSTQGVTARTIRIGVASINVQAVAQFTHGLNQGDFKGAYTALINYTNKHGGINGRKIVPTFVSVKPLQSSSADAACTQLTEDDKVFAVIGEFYTTAPQCYVDTHATPVVGGTMNNQILAEAKAPWFTMTPNDDTLEPVAVTAAARAGVFKHKSVAVLSESDVVPSVKAGVSAALKKAGVTPKVTASIQAGSDSEAVFQEVSGVIAPKMQAAGVNVLVALGGSVAAWADATGGGTYHPQLVGTNYPDTNAYTLGSAKANPAVAANAVTVWTKPLANQGKAVGWADPAMQRCAKIEKAAGVKFTSPVSATSSSDSSYTAVSQSCRVMALFTAIAGKAGRNLTNASFAKAGDTLGAMNVPGLGTAVYSAQNPSGSFPLYVYTWNEKLNRWDVSAKPFGVS